MIISFKKQTEEGQWWTEEESASELDVSETAYSYVDDSDGGFITDSEGDDSHLDGGCIDEADETDAFFSIVATDFHDYNSDDNGSMDDEDSEDEIVLEIGDPDLTSDGGGEEEMIAEESSDESQDKWFVEDDTSDSESIVSQELVSEIMNYESTSDIDN